ncbi:MAG: hypothetical protein FWD15_04230 [Alphaproteobacteria bacterium]|nr:hypothetical protein [Alphaproteobacteria bacterium]
MMGRIIFIISLILAAGANAQVIATESYVYSARGAMCITPQYLINNYIPVNNIQISPTHTIRGLNYWLEPYAKKSDCPGGGSPCPASIAASGCTVANLGQNTQLANWITPQECRCNSGGGFFWFNGALRCGCPQWWNQNEEADIERCAGAGYVRCPGINTGSTGMLPIQ